MGELRAGSIQLPTGILDIAAKLLPLLRRQALRALRILRILPPRVVTTLFVLPALSLPLEIIRMAGVAN